jgi:hypothetical protein
MTIKLTTPVSVLGEELTEVKIVVVGIGIEDKQIQLTCQYGNTVDGTWIPSAKLERVTHLIENKLAINDTEKEITPADLAYDEAITSVASEAGAYLYDEVASNLYQFLLDRSLYKGVIS